MIHGTCNCQSVVFQIKAPLPGFYRCHCSLCRKQGGSSSNFATIVKYPDFIWLKGEDHIVKWKKSTGFNSHFCKVCGSPLPNSLMDETYMWVPAGLIEDAEIVLKAELFCDSKAHWDETINPNAACYETMPGSIKAFVESLYQLT